MGLKKAFLTVSVLSASLNAHATLTSYTGAGGVGLVYSSVSDVTWTHDASLFKTLYDSDNALILKIASVTPLYNDPVFGLQTIDSHDFNTTMGTMSWWAANAFVSYLRSISFGGSNQWRLPEAGSDPQIGYNQTGGEFGQLYYSELGALAYPGTNGTDFGILGDGQVVTSGSVGPFLNAQTYGYWFGTEYSPSRNWTWTFHTNSGHQNINAFRDPQYYVWPVSAGRVAAVPLPAASWLMITGLLGLFGRNNLKVSNRAI
ncbi:hypothetical protein ACQE3E_15465 [Methylomonas sp. MED-D]|uniref:hypothetical protein n=1 Tax=Methylomonas sp. MED-D TaxID=3418768 RepID=UPI003D092872